LLEQGFCPGAKGAISFGVDFNFTHNSGLLVDYLATGKPA